MDLIITFIAAECIRPPQDKAAATSLHLALNYKNSLLRALVDGDVDVVKRNGQNAIGRCSGTGLAEFDQSAGQTLALAVDCVLLHGGRTSLSPRHVLQTLCANNVLRIGDVSMESGNVDAAACRRGSKAFRDVQVAGKPEIVDIEALSISIVNGDGRGTVDGFCQSSSNEVPTSC